MEKRVVVTGMGILSCAGGRLDTFWKNVVEGNCGIETITEYPDNDLDVKIGGKIRNFNPEEYGIEKPFARKQDKFVVYAMASACQAMEDSGLVSGENIDPYRFGCFIGSGCGGFETICEATKSIVDFPTGQWVSPHFVPKNIINMAAGQIAIRFQAQGPNMGIVTACATSTHALGEAYRTIKHGYADAMITGGSDNCTIPVGIAGFTNTKALSLRNDPKHSLRPFDKNRAGFVMADGSAMLVLEEYEHALKRGAHIYAEVVGYGSTCDAYHATAPRPDAEPQAECIRQALKEASFDSASDKVYVNAHGTGTVLNDSTETKALKLAFGDYAGKLHISSTKSVHGHMIGATGAAEAIASVLALRDDTIPPTINLTDPDPECDLDYTPGKAIKTELTLAISDSFGFGGHNACVAFRKIR